MKMRPGRAASVASSRNSVGGEVDGRAGDLGPHPRHVEDDVAGADRRRPARRPLGPAQDGPDAGDELARAERLGQVVVGAELEPEQLVELVVASGEHHDRDRRVAAQLAGDVEAVEAGQAEVEDDEVGAGAGGSSPSAVGPSRRSARRSPRARGSRGRAGRSSASSSTTRMVFMRSHRRARRMRPRTRCPGARGGGGTASRSGGAESAGSGRSAGRSSAPSVAVGLAVPVVERARWRALPGAVAAPRVGVPARSRAPAAGAPAAAPAGPPARRSPGSAPNTMNRKNSVARKPKNPKPKPSQEP